MIHYKFVHSAEWHTLPISYKIHRNELARFIQRTHSFKHVYVLSPADMVWPNAHVEVSTVAPRRDVQTPFVKIPKRGYDIDVEFGPDPYESRPLILERAFQKFETDDDFINDNTDVMILKKFLHVNFK